MADEFANLSDSASAPASNAVAVVPHATNPLADISKALFIGGAGNLVCRLVGDTADVTFTGVQAGQILPIRVSHVRSATTATSIVALY
jgi:hypothetical protein